MTIKQELMQIKNKLILADIEVDTIAQYIKPNMTEEEVDKALKKIEKLKEEIEGCI